MSTIRHSSNRLIGLATVLAVAILALAACQQAGTQASAPAEVKTDELVIYAYDSFASEWGPGPAVIPLFEQASGCKVTLVSKGDAGQVLSAALLEKAAPQADVVIGLDNNLLGRALEADVLQAYKPAGSDAIPADLVLDPEFRLTPYDYGYFALVWDSEKLAAPPASLADLAKPEFAGKLILMDPRTSTPGLGFLAMAVAAYGEGWQDWWQSIKPSILTVTSGWDAGYGMFTQGEAPLVISYTTSPAYHVEYDKTERYKAVLFAEGQSRQIEGAGILKGARNAVRAREFMDFLISLPCQEKLPLTQWMYPVNPQVTLPASFAFAPQATKVLSADPAKLDQALAAWADAASK